MAAVTWAAHLQHLAHHTVSLLAIGRRAIATHPADGAKVLPVPRRNTYAEARFLQQGPTHEG